MKKQIMKLKLNSRGGYSLGADCDGEVCTLGDLFLDVGDWILDWLEDPVKCIGKDLAEEGVNLKMIYSNMVAVEKKNGLIEISDLLDDEEEYNFYIEEDKLKELLKIWKELTSKKVKKILLTWDGVNIELKEDIS